MTHPTIKTRVEDTILFVSIDRPEKRNALTPDMIDAISAAVRSADDNPAVRAVVVHATGPIFSAGVDLSMIGQMAGETNGQNPARTLRRLAERLQSGAQHAGSNRGAGHRRVAWPGVGLGIGTGIGVRLASCQR